MIEEDIDQLQKIVRQLYVAKIEHAFGEDGVNTTETVTSAISNIYLNLDRSTFSQITIFKQLTDEDILEKGIPVYDVQNFSRIRADKLIVEILNNGSYKILTNKTIEIEPLSHNAIVYIKEKEKEYFCIKGEIENLARIGNLDTYFIKPTFKSLDNALENYNTSKARTSTCLILRKLVWKDGEGGNRIVYVAKPEHIMRDSMYQFLDSYLRGNKEVLREQNVNDKNPVDIRVTWGATNHVALIEIKWIGLSASGTGYEKQSAVTRSNKGAKQLADYLDSFRTESPRKSVRGYLVIFDGRRNNISKDTTTVSYDDGFYYANSEIDFNPDYNKIRNDFEKPVRIFMEAICN